MTGKEEVAVNEERFLELFPEIDKDGIWKKEESREEKSQKKMEDKQKNRKQREEFFEHIKAQMKPDKQWELLGNAELLKYKIKLKKYQNFGITKKIMVYTATAAACLILVIVLPNLSNFLKMSDQQDQDVLKKETDYSKQETADEPVNITESMDVSNQNIEKDSEETANNLEKNNDKIQPDDEEIKQEQDLSGFYSKKKKEKEEKDTNEITPQKQTLEQETKQIKDRKQEKKEKITDESNLKNLDNEYQDNNEFDNTTQTDSLISESIADSPLPESVVEDTDSSLPESCVKEEQDSSLPESIAENIDIPTMGSLEESSQSVAEITSATAENNKNIENEISANTGIIESDIISEFFPDNIEAEESSEVPMDTSAAIISSAFEYALIKGEGREISLEGEKEFSRLEMEQKLKANSYLYYKENDKEVWYQPIQETIETVNEKELLGTAFIFKEKTAIENAGIEVSIYGNREDLSLLFVRFFAEGVYWYYGYQEYQE